MSTLANRLSELPEVSGFCAEGAQLVRQAEERLHRISQDSEANEGTRQAAADIVRAMRRVQLLIEAHQDGTGKGMAFSPVVCPAPEKPRWWKLTAWVGQFRTAVSHFEWLTCTRSGSNSSGYLLSHPHPASLEIYPN